MADNTTIYPSHAIEIIAWNWPELSNDVPGDYSVASVGDGTVKLNWTTSAVPQPTPDDIEALRQSPEWLSMLKEQKHDLRRKARTAAELSPFMFNGHLIDSDRDSVLRIGNAATAALIAASTEQPFEVTWTCADDYQMPLDAQGVMALQMALAQHGAAAHAGSQALKAAIDSGTTIEELNAVDLETGWLS